MSVVKKLWKKSGTNLSLKQWATVALREAPSEDEAKVFISWFKNKRHHSKGGKVHLTNQKKPPCVMRSKFRKPKKKGKKTK